MQSSWKQRLKLLREVEQHDKQTSCNLTLHRWKSDEGHRAYSPVSMEIFLQKMR